MTARSVKHKVTCPYCLDTHDMASKITSAKGPANGDVSFCITCGKFGIFDSTTPQGSRKPTVKEAMHIASDLKCFQLKVAWNQIKGENRVMH